MNGFLVVCLFTLLAYVIWEESSKPEDIPQLGLAARPREQDYYNRLIDGFLDGHAYLKLPVPAELLQLKDPYDPRANFPIRYAGGDPRFPRYHDLSYYRGHFYLYFSAVPAVALFQPFRILTGLSLSHREACLLFGFAGFLAQAWLLRRMRRDVFAHVSDGVFALSALALGITNLMPLILRRPDVWEVPICAAYAFASLAALAWYGVLRAERRRYDLLAAVGLCSALALGCRPNTAPLLALLCGSAAYRTLSTARAGRLPALLALSLPVAAIGIALAGYNFVRYGHPLDFGLKYQLSGDASPFQRPSPSLFFFNLKLYLLQPPTFSSEFPFVAATLPTWFPDEHHGVESVIGVVIWMPVVLLAPFALLWSWRQRRSAAGSACLWCLATLVLSALGNLAALCIVPGGCVRYQLDFAPLLAMAGVAGILALEEWDATGTRRPWRRLTWSLCLALSLLGILLERNNPQRLLYGPAGRLSDVHPGVHAPAQLASAPPRSWHTWANRR